MFVGECSADVMMTSSGGRQYPEIGKSTLVRRCWNRLLRPTGEPRRTFSIHLL